MGAQWIPFSPDLIKLGPAFCLLYYDYIFPPQCEWLQGTDKERKSCGQINKRDEIIFCHRLNSASATWRVFIVRFLVLIHSGLIADDNGEVTEVNGKLQTSFIKEEEKVI